MDYHNGANHPIYKQIANIYLNREIVNVFMNLQHELNIIGKQVAHHTQECFYNKGLMPMSKNLDKLPLMIYKSR
jgi:hypothetical protein